jgi:Ca-activated chloride channel homolog
MTAMSFLAPSRLWLLVLLAGLVVLYVWMQQRRRHYAVRFTNLDLLSSVAPRRPGWRRHVAAGLVALGLASMVIAIARPQRDERIAREHATIMLVLDVSASMAATDVQPSRMASAIEAASDFVADVPEQYELGLIAFDRTTRVLATPTTDRAELLASLQALTIGTGTATGDAIVAAVQTIAAHEAATDGDEDGDDDDAEPADDPAEVPVSAIVLLSDGKATVGADVDAASSVAAAAGIPVSTIAYGTPDGVVSIEGELVPVPADEVAMAEVAEATGGKAFTAESGDQLDSVYSSIEERVGYTTEPREILRVFVVLGMLLLVAGIIASMIWTGRFL